MARSIGTEKNLVSVAGRAQFTLHNVRVCWLCILLATEDRSLRLSFVSLGNSPQAHGLNILFDFNLDSGK